MMVTQSLLSELINVKSPCLHPWGYLWINAAGLVSFCPQNKSVLGSIHENSIAELWNNETAIHTRQLITENRYEEAQCQRECPYLRGKFTHPEESIPIPELIFPDCNPSLINAENVLQNLTLLTKSYRAYEYRVDHLPIVLDCQPILKCNAGCIMCGQPHDSDLKHDNVAWKRIAEVAPSLTAIRWQGGEVFLDNQFIDRVEEISRISHDQLIKVIITNGSCLTNDMVDRIVKEASPVKFIISIDGATKETVRSIRKNISITNVFDCLSYLAKMRATHQSCDVIWNYTVMSKNVHEVEAAILAAKRLVVDINLAAIQGPYEELNFFEYKLIDEQAIDSLISRWEELANDKDVTVTGIDGLKSRLKN